MITFFIYSISKRENDNIFQSPKLTFFPIIHLHVQFILGFDFDYQRRRPPLKQSAQHPQMQQQKSNKPMKGMMAKMEAMQTHPPFKELCSMKMRLVLSHSIFSF